MLTQSKLKLLVASLAIASCVSACGRSSLPNSSGNPGSTSAYGSGGGPVPGPRSGRLLFQTNRSHDDLTALKLEFLQATRVVQPVHGVNRFNVNSVRGPSFQPISPLVHTYHGVGANVPVAVKLSESFRWNIPQEIRDQIIQFDVDSLDILFTPQEEIRAQDDSLKAAYWMFPNRPPLNQIVGAPREYQDSILLRLFDSDHPIDGQVTTDQLRRFGVSLHDGLVSPDTGHINTAGAPLGSFSFYSLAIFESQRRAAVTLHWMLTVADRQTLVAMLQGTQAPGAVNSFENLLQAMNDPVSPFHGTPMMRKLNALLNP